MIEEWRDIPGFEGLYQCSSMGRLKSFDRDWHLYHGGICKRKGKLLKPNIHKDGYHCIGLSKNNKPKVFLIHRIVALLFIDNPLNLNEINHIDGDKSNNTIDNLEWVTHKQNMAHAYDNKLNQNTLENHAWAKLNIGIVSRIRFLTGKVEKGYWPKLAKALGIDIHTIYDVIHNRSWRGI